MGKSNPTNNATSVEVVETGAADASINKPEIIIHDKLAFVGEVGGNGAQVTYQDAKGAPVEATSPLGYHVGPYTSAFLNVGMIVGTGIFSTPANILKGTGSVGLAFIYWVLGLLISLAGVSVYLEFASYFSSRSGGEVVYLEQAFPKPTYFWPLAFAFQTVVLSFSSSNAFVLATWIYRLAGVQGTDWQIKGVAIAGMTVVCLIALVHNRGALWLVNAFGFVKICTLIFIAFTGFVALGGGFKSVPNPKANFHNAFEGTGNDAYNLCNALVSIIYSYWGYNNCFNVTNEVKNPIRTIRISANLSLIIIFVLYMFVNTAYFAVLPKAEILKSTQITATLYFERLFGERAAKGLTILPIVSCLGNMLAVVIGHSRQVREIGRQGLLPWTEFWVSTKPFGTPGGSVAFAWFISVVMIIIPPAGDAFQFIISLQNYPQSFFLALMAIGLFVVRRQRARLGFPKPEYRSYSWVAIFFILANAFLLVMPWVPPKDGLNDSAFHFFYATSSIVGMAFIFLCYLYYVLWIYILPKLRNYSVRSTVLYLEDGSVSNRLLKIPNDQVDAWDAKHDVSGRSISSESGKAASVVNSQEDDGRL